MPDAYRQWREDLKEDPSLFWRTALVRIAIWIILGIAILVGGQLLINSMRPSDAARGERASATALATLYVACTHAECLAAFTSKQPMSFREWPLACEKCKRQSAYRAQICAACREWYATAPDQPLECPRCAAAARVKAEKERPKPKKKGSKDDEEDDW